MKMPRHLLTKRDSGELKFKITRLPSDDSFMNSQKSTSSLLSLSSLNESDDSTLDISGNISLDGNYGLFSPPKTMMTNTSPLSSPKSSTLSPKASSPTRNIMDGGVLGTITHNTNTNNPSPSKMPANTLSSSSSSFSSSSGVLGVKKNFLHRAFQKNFSPGKVYRGEENKFEESTSTSIPHFGADSSEENSTTNFMKGQNSTASNSVTESDLETDATRRAVSKMIPGSLHRLPVHGISDSTENFDTNNSSLTIKSPTKKVTILKFDPKQVNTENTHSLYSKINSHRLPLKDTENKSPEMLPKVKVSNSPKFKINLHASRHKSKSNSLGKQSPHACSTISSPRKLIESRNISSPRKLIECRNISSPRKLDYPSTLANRQQQSVNITRQEYFKDTTIPKMNILDTREKSIVFIDNAKQEDCPKKVQQMPRQLCVIAKSTPKREESPLPKEEYVTTQRSDGEPSKHQTLEEQDHVSACPQDPFQNGSHPPALITNTNLQIGAQTNQQTLSPTPTLTTTPLSVSEAQNKCDTFQTHDIKNSPQPKTQTASPPPIAQTKIKTHTDDNTHKTKVDSKDKKMAFQPIQPYQFFYAQGVTTGLPAASPLPHTLPHTIPHTIPPHLLYPLSHSLTPSTQLTGLQNDSGYQTPGSSFNNSNNNRSSNATNDKNSSSSTEKLSTISNWTLPTLSPPAVLTLPSSITSPPQGSSHSLETKYSHPLLTSTPVYPYPNGQNLSDNNAERNHPRSAFQTYTPPGPPFNPAIMQHMAYMASLNYNPYAMPIYPHNHPLPQQQAPLDLSSSEETTSTSTKPIRKKLFSGKQSTSGNVQTQHSTLENPRQQVKQEADKNPFGINKILGVESPAKVEPYPVEERCLDLQYSSPPGSSNGKRKRNASEPSGSNDENSQSCTAEGQEPAKKKKKRDKPPQWGEQVPDLEVKFFDCYEKEIFCDTQGEYQVPKIPEEREKQLEMMESLLRLFENSNLPPVPLGLRKNIFGLRFYPLMKTIWQASQYKDSRTLVPSYGGLAFENFRMIDDNSIIDKMLMKDGAIYRCLTKKCINPLGTTCSFVATSLGKMRRHIKNHMPDKKWVCAFCRTQMSDQTDMARHGTTHTNLRPFPCEECGKGFGQKITQVTHNLKTHGIIIGKDTQNHHTCRHCGVNFTASERESCIDHLRKFHFEQEYQTLRKKRKFPFNVTDECSE